MTNVERIVAVVVLGALAVGLGLSVLGGMPTGADWGAAAFFAGLGLLATLLSYPVGRATSGSISFLPFLTVAAVAPNVAAVLAVAASVTVAEIVQRRALIKASFNVAQDVLGIGLAIAVFRTLAPAESAAGAPSQVTQVFALAATYFFVNKLAVSTVIAVSTGASVFTQWIKSVRGSILYDALSTPLVILLAAVYSSKGPVWAALAALPMLGIRQLYRMVFALEKINEELLQLMVASIEARDPYTSGHSQRVSRYAQLIAQVAGLNGKWVDRAVVAALLHDVGKIFEEFAPILRKPGRLTEEEYLVMQSHPIKSAELVAKVSHFADLVPAVRAHHEAWDGSGYPDQLRGENIPVIARIISIADTIDAMSTSRPYRAAMSAELVREEIRVQSGKQFDPRLCEAILSPTAWRRMEAEIVSANIAHPIAHRSETEGRTAEFYIPR